MFNAWETVALAYDGEPGNQVGVSGVLLVQMQTN